MSGFIDKFLAPHFKWLEPLSKSYEKSHKNHRRGCYLFFSKEGHLWHVEWMWDYFKRGQLPPPNTMYKRGCSVDSLQHSDPNFSETLWTIFEKKGKVSEKLWKQQGNRLVDTILCLVGVGFHLGVFCLRITELTIWLISQLLLCEYFSKDR